jgi:hypothetical protein
MIKKGQGAAIDREKAKEGFKMAISNWCVKTQ